VSSALPELPIPESKPLLQNLQSLFSNAPLFSVHYCAIHPLQLTVWYSMIRYRIRAFLSSDKNTRQIHGKFLLYSIFTLAFAG
jgi:hypothetical protein